MKNLLMGISICMCFTTQGQENKSRFIDKGLLRADGAFSAGLMSNANSPNLYLNGSLEYYVNQSISIRSESYYLLQSDLYQSNHSNFVGIMYHIKTKGQFDPYIGVQPGIVYSGLIRPETIASSDDDPIINGYTKSTFNPTFSVSTGFNYYASKIFHLFIHAKYVAGNHIYPLGKSSLNELKVSFGLGWNIWVIKKNKSG